jgi:hypothetical protein
VFLFTGLFVSLIRKIINMNLILGIILIPIGIVLVLYGAKKGEQPNFFESNTIHGPALKLIIGGIMLSLFGLYLILDYFHIYRDF